MSLQHYHQEPFLDMEDVGEIEKFMSENLISITSSMERDVTNSLQVDPDNFQERYHEEDNKEYLLQTLESNALLQQDPVAMMNSNNIPHMQQNCNMQFIPQQPAVLTNEDYPGPYNFEILINSQTVSKNSWVYSTLLKKIFINMSNPLPIDFKWTPPINGLVVRATPLYSLPQHAQEFVTRCIPHAAHTDVSNKEMPDHTWNHVLRCLSQNAQYHGNIQDGHHLSVVVPLGQLQPGSDVVRHMYQFVCKNSCPSGMNRKPFEVVFTLEKMDGQIIGRRTVSVRVCSCPKRDKDKEENEIRKSDHPPPTKKRRLNNSLHSLEKKPSINNDDGSNKIYQISIPIVGKANRDYILKIAHSLMVEESSSSGNYDIYKNVIADLHATRNRD